MDTSMSVLRERKWPPMEVVEPCVGSPLRRDKRSRADARRTALVADMAKVKEHARWRNPELKSRVDATQSSVAKRVDAAISLWVAEACNRVSGQELPDEGERRTLPWRWGVKVEKLRARNSFEASELFEAKDITKAVVTTRWVLTSPMLGGKKCAKAHLAARGYQGPDLKESIVDTSDCVRLRSSHFRVISLGATETWEA